MAALQYLTVQDILWINLQVTGATQPFDYADLEEATFYQYGYGTSTSLIPQAARFLKGFIKKKPLRHGNKETAFYATLGFLAINGVKLNVSDGKAWLDSVANGFTEAQDAIMQAIVEEHGDVEHGHVPEVRAVLGQLLVEYGSVIAVEQTT